MKRGILKWFYIAVQFIMLLVSIPKVGALFHAYDSEAFGPLFLGLDLRSWLVGIAIDATAALTSWAAMTKYEATRHSRDLLAPAIIILFCTSISIIANYEDAAVHAPAQFAHVTLFAVSVLLINPILVSSPPAIVFLLIVLVPSVMAEPRLKSAAELALEAQSMAAKIEAEAQIKMAKTRAKAQVRRQQVYGLRDTWNARKGVDESAQDGADNTAGDGEDEPPDDRGPDRGPGGGMRAHHSADASAGNMRGFSLITSGEMRAVRTRSTNDVPLHKRVRAAGMITVNDLEDALGISDSRAREILISVPTSVRTSEHKNARIEAPVADVLQYLCAHKSPAMKAHGMRLDAALHPRRSARSNPRSSAYADARFTAGRTPAPMRAPVRGATLGSAVAASAVLSAPENAPERGQLVRFPSPAGQTAGPTDAQFSGGNIRA